MNHLSYTELEQSLAQGQEWWAFLPVGCWEQHGPVLPLAADTLVAEELAHRLQVRLKKTRGTSSLVLPCISFTPTEPNRDFAGTVSMPNAAGRNYLEAVLRGILRTPYKVIVVINGHGSVDPILKEVGFQLVLEQFQQSAPVRPILCLNAFDPAPTLAREFGQPHGRHADWTELLLTYPLLGPEYYDAVRLQRLEQFAASDTFDVVAPRVLGIPMELRSVQGVSGNPMPPGGIAAVAQTAERYWERLVDLVFETMLSEIEAFSRSFSTLRAKVGP